VLLILDLNQPTRFWHMLLKSQVVNEALAQGWPWSAAGWRLMADAPLLKYWSPMSIGSWALTLFGACSFLSLLGSLWPGGRLERLLRRGVPGRALQVVGCLVGFFIASYTGALLTATNQPVWSDSSWIAPLFLTSAASTGVAALLLVAYFRRELSPQTLQRLERADRWALLLELAFLAVFLASLGVLLPIVWGTWHGKLLAVGVPLLGVLLPLALHLRPGVAGRHGTVIAAALALAGGLLLRYAILGVPPELLARGPGAVPGVPASASSPRIPGFSPEDGRTAGDPGADPLNRPATPRPDGKLQP
jgi:formate-dependent nitrite reductase membrane component NrfD